MPDYIKTHKEFKKLLDEFSNLIVVDFTATWCGPCQDIAPFYDELAEKYEDVVFVKVDVDENEETSEYCEITGMPTFQFYRNGEKIKEIIGGDRKNLVDSIETYRIMQINTN
jgi:thioredoxin 1